MENTKRIIRKAEELATNLVVEFEKNEAAFFSSNEKRKNLYMKLNVVKNVLESVKARLSTVKSPAFAQQKTYFINEVNQMIAVINQIIGIKITAKQAQVGNMLATRQEALGWIARRTERKTWEPLVAKFLKKRNKIPFKLPRLGLALRTLLALVILTGSAYAEMNITKDMDTLAKMYKGHRVIQMMSESQEAKAKIRIQELETRIAKSGGRAIDDIDATMERMEVEFDAGTHEMNAYFHKRIAADYKQVAKHIKSGGKAVVDGNRIRLIDASGKEVGYVKHTGIYGSKSTEDAFNVVKQLHDTKQLAEFFSAISD